MSVNVILHASNVEKSFRGIHVLRDIEFALPRGQITALIGSNGAGKSTLLNLISGFVPADRGTIEFNGRRIEALSSYRRARLGISRSFQHPRVFASLTVLESVQVAATPTPKEGLFRNLMRIGRDEVTSASAESQRALDVCRLSHRKDNMVSELGYGEQKLLMLAQLLAKGGSLLCLDELCAGVGDALADEVMIVLRELQRKGITILFIEHNLELVRTIADHVVFLHQGKIMLSGTTEVVLEDPEVNRLYLGQ
mgnify:CR=1 FL=1